jgi:hypothetical protein
MISWDYLRDEDDRYQREMDAVERERMVAGWEPPMGWRRPVDPMCPTHRYGLVDGLCGVCVQEASLSEREFRGDGQGSEGVTHSGPVRRGPVNASHVPVANPPARSESDEAAA